MIHGWRPAGDNQDEIAGCETVGFLIADDNKKVVLAMSKSTDGNILETISIPRKSIVGIKQLRVR